MKKLFATAVVLLIILILAACVKGGNGESGGTEGPSEIAAGTLLPTDENTDTATPEATENPKAEATPEVTDAPTETEIAVFTAIPTPAPTEAPTATPTPKPTTVEAIIENMTIDEKIYQLFIVTPEDITGGKTMTKVDATTLANLKNYPAGGIIYFASNLENPTQTKTMLSDLQKASVNNIGVPLFMCVDEEGGRVARIANNPSFGVQNVGAMYTITSEEAAKNAGLAMGKYLSELGFNFDFAPVADVTTDGIDSHVNDRSFGSDPESVTKFATAVSKGLGEYNVMSCFKHFPGHGATATDTHNGLGYTTKTKAELLAHDLVPFAKAQENEIPAIMVSHMSVPDITGDYTPASLSYTMITELLRGELGYEGLILTDALNMGAIANEYGAGEAAVMAIKAGNDMILMPDDFQAAITAVKAAVARGEITEARLDESLERILAVKFNFI